MEVGAGELPQLLRYLKLATTPTPLPTPVKEEVKEEEPIDVISAGSSVKKEEITMFIEKPIHISLGGSTKQYRCGNCDIAPKRSKSGMDACTKKALLCSFCSFFTYNFDSLNRHMKEHN